MRSAVSRVAPIRLCALRTASARSRWAPASVPSAVRKAPSFTVIVSPNSIMLGSCEPTVAIASDTSMSFRADFAANAARAETGWT